MKAQIEPAPGGFVLQCTAENAEEFALLESAWNNRKNLVGAHPKPLSFTSGGGDLPELKLFFVAGRHECGMIRSDIAQELKTLALLRSLATYPLADLSAPIALC